MFKHRQRLLLSFAAACVSSVTFAAPRIVSVSLVRDGKVLAHAYIVAGKTYVPIAALGKLFDARVRYDKEEDRVYLQTDSKPPADSGERPEVVPPSLEGRTRTVPVDINGKRTDYKAYVLGNMAYLPLESVKGIFNIEVDVDAKKGEVAIRKRSGDKSGVGESSWSDNFNDGPRKDWKPETGDWVDVDNGYSVSPMEAHKHYRTFVGEESWRDYTVEVDVYPGDGGAETGLIVRASSPDNYLLFTIEDLTHARWNKVLGGKESSAMERHEVSLRKGERFHLRLEVEGDTATAYLDSQEVSTLRFDEPALGRGRVGLTLYAEEWKGSWHVPRFDNAEVRLKA